MTLSSNSVYPNWELEQNLLILPENENAVKRWIITFVRDHHCHISAPEEPFAILHPTPPRRVPPCGRSYQN